MEKIVQVFPAGETDAFGAKSILLGVLTNKGRIFVQAVIQGDNGPEGVWMEMPHPDFKSISSKKK